MGRDKKPAPWRPVPYARYPSSEFGTIPFVFSHGHFGFHKKSAASVCMILVISWEARRQAGAIKATPATNLMVFPAVSDHSRLLVRLAFIGRPRWGLRSRELVVRSLRHLPMNSRIQGGLLPDFSRARWIDEWTTGRLPPKPPTSRTDARGVGSPALCVANGLSRDRDGLDRVTYWVGIGVSWKPIAIALRCSTLNILALVLASYSSIDWTTYSWPYFSIL